MSINTTDLNTLSTAPSQSSTTPAATDAATSAGTTGSADGAAQTKLTPAILKQQLNASILQASLEVSISSQNDPLSLVYKSAIENLNDILKPQLGDNAIQTAASQDNSPEATAGRILSFIKSAFGLFSQASQSSSATDAQDTSSASDKNAGIDNFMSQVQKGVDMGFDEARGILSSLKVLNGDIASNIDKTYDLVKKGIADFIASIKNPPTDDGSGTGDGSSSSSTSTTVSVSISVTASRTEITNY